MADQRKRRGMRLTIITTKFGDSGETYISGGFVLKKNHPRVKAYGTVDELASFVGYTISVMREGDEKMSEFTDILEKIQNHLFILGGDLARLLKPSDEITETHRRVTEKMVNWVEELEKKYIKELEPLEDFILPGGSKESSLFHILRTVSRRCEREIVELSQIEKVNPKCIKYINRLSDLFFILARVINKRKGVGEKIVNWEQ
ncbi:MAG: cob(I)yrinic acid a,c-diamide adenosyltransferase [bacterium]|nr:cob(I)yrinic acid a,c-diamide adenosyltransferase [bacterium]